MNRIIRQVFGTTSPKEIFQSVFTFDRLLTRPLVHIIYWAGLGLLFLAAMGIFGVAVGSSLKDGTLIGVLLSFPMLIGGWLMVLIGILMWRGFCEFYMSVMNIASDLRYLRQYQEKLESPAAPVVAPAPAPVAAAASSSSSQGPLRFRDPASFDVPTPDTYSEPGVAEKESGDILEDPFFRPRFGKAE